MEPVYPPELIELLRRALSRSRRRLRVAAPSLSGHARTWVQSLSPGSPPEAYFTHPKAFPTLLLPWWLENQLHGTPSAPFHGEVVYSTVNGYYFVRLIDDLMDRERPLAPALLPSLIFFHTEFLRTYQRYFPDGHPFWETFVSVSYASAEAASRDASLKTVDRAHFLDVSARKIGGAKVPLAAVCHRYGRPDLLEPWSGFVDLLGRWHQMLNDVLGWRRDLDEGRATYFLFEAASRADPDGSISEWVISDGLAWALDQLETWADELLSAAEDLASPPIVAYVKDRRATLAGDWRALQPDLVALRHLAAILR